MERQTKVIACKRQKSQLLLIVLGTIAIVNIRVTQWYMYVILSKPCFWKDLVNQNFLDEKPSDCIMQY